MRDIGASIESSFIFEISIQMAKGYQEILLVITFIVSLDLCNLDVNY